MQKKFQNAYPIGNFTPNDFALRDQFNILELSEILNQSLRAKLC